MPPAIRIDGKRLQRFSNTRGRWRLIDESQRVVKFIGDQVVAAPVEGLPRCYPPASAVSEPYSIRSSVCSERQIACRYAMHICAGERLNRTVIRLSSFSVSRFCFNVTVAPLKSEWQSPLLAAGAGTNARGCAPSKRLPWVVKHGQWALSAFPLGPSATLPVLSVLQRLALLTLESSVSGCASVRLR
jgi:hypothetical protein